MTVKKPLEKPKTPAVDVDALIARGAKVKEDISEKKKWTFINVRIPTEMLQSIDVVVSDRVGITRTGWILESIHEKLKELRNG